MMRDKAPEIEPWRGLSTGATAPAAGKATGRCKTAVMAAGPRFLTLPDVAEILNTSLAQVTALVRRGELRGIQIGGRGQWRVETSELEDFIQRMYAQTEARLEQQRRSGQELSDL